MRLLQIKLRGLGELPVTNWVFLNRTLTLLRFSDGRIGRRVLSAIQSLNPPYDCTAEKPFRDLPREEVLASGYRRAITPGKRTVVIGIFDTPASLVKELGAITPLLYETDRIEVGRRLDYSRWTNFVEIASSSRWSEVSQDLVKLLLEYPDGPEALAVRQLAAEAVPADRVKGAMAEKLAAWLTALEPHQSAIDGYPAIVEKVQRATKFAAARHLLARRLPQFFTINGDDAIRGTAPETDRHEAPLSPVLLIDCLDATTPAHTRPEVPEKIGLLAERSQCLCFTTEHHCGWALPAAQVVDFDELSIYNDRASQSE